MFTRNRQQQSSEGETKATAADASTQYSESESEFKIDGPPDFKNNPQAKTSLLYFALFGRMGLGIKILRSDNRNANAKDRVKEKEFILPNMVDSIARDIVNMPKLQYLNNFTAGSFLRNIAYKYNSDRHWSIKSFETLFRLVHNLILCVPALFTILEKAALLFMINGRRVNDYGWLGPLVIIGKIVASIVFMCARIISCTIWAVLDPINNIKSIWNNPTLSRGERVCFIVASAVASCAAYAFAPVLLLKFAPLFMAKILVPLKALGSPLKALASWPPITKIATAVSAAPKAVALTAVCVASGLLNTISAVFNSFVWGRKKSSAQSRARTGSMSSAGPDDDDNDSRSRTSSIRTMGA